MKNEEKYHMKRKKPYLLAGLVLLLFLRQYGGANRPAG